MKKHLVDNKRGFLFRDSMPFAVKEGYRTLRTNIIFSQARDTSSCIGMTSAVEGEGKTTTIINTALAFSQINKKVLLIDCDLRAPQVENYLHLDKEQGLTDYLVGEISLDEAIVKYNKNLDVLVSGKIPREATGLLESNKLSKLILHLKELYDYVFIDLPPVVTMADASIMSKNIDGYILVVSHEKSKYKEVLKAINQLEIVNAKIFGLVYNNAELQDVKYRKYK